MATVPGDPNESGPDPYGGIPPGLRPGYPELLMAAAIHKQQQDQKLAAGWEYGRANPLDPLDVQGKRFDPKGNLRIQQTERPLYGKGDELEEGPMKLTPGLTTDPKAKGWTGVELEPGDEGVIEGKVPLPKPKPKKEKATRYTLEDFPRTWQTSRS